VSRNVDGGVSVSRHVVDGVHGREEGCKASLVPLNDMGFNESRQIDGRLLSEDFSDLRFFSGRNVRLSVRRVFGAGVLFSLSWFGMKKALADATLPRKGTLAAPTFSPTAGCMAEATTSLSFFALV